MASGILSTACVIMTNNMDQTYRNTPVYSEVIIDNTFVKTFSKRKYESQFNSLYQHRSNELKKRVMKLAMPKWNGCDINGMKTKFFPKILDVPFSKPCFIIGTTLADMKYKPDVLKEVELSVQGHFKELNELNGKAPDSMQDIDKLRKASYSDPKTDKLWLEDESGRILLTGDLLNKKILVTGLVIGVLGMEIESGIFHVVDIMYPEAAPQKVIEPSLNKEGKLLLCSGLNVSSKSDFSKYEMLSSWICGEFGDIERILSINEMMILGNSLGVNDIQENDTEIKSNKPKKNKYIEDFNSQYEETSVKYLDDFFSKLLQSVPISLLSGINDVVESGLPKQAVHQSLFSKSSKAENFHRLTNPSFYEINGVRILATSGENIDDIMKYIIPNISVTEDLIDESITNDSRLRIIEDSLLWQIIAPTAPDTLWCYPFENSDPFTLMETPHVYVIGNQPKYETSLIELKRKNGESVTIRIIALPKFSDSNTCVLLDLQSLRCESVEFN